MASQARLIFWKCTVVIAMREASPPVGIEAKKVEDYEAVPMQIGFVCYSAFRQESKTLLFSSEAVFSPSSAIVSRGSLCLILVVCVIPLVSAVTPFGLERDSVSVHGET